MDRVHEQFDSKSPWADKRVRLAANLAIGSQDDQRGRVSRVRQAAFSMIPRDFEFHWAPPPYPFDPAKAKQLPGRSRLPQGLRRGRDGDRCRLRAGGRGVINGFQAIRDPRAAPADGARRDSTRRIRKDVQASGPRRPARPPATVDPHRGVRDLPGIRSYGATRTSIALPRSGGRDGQEARGRCCTRFSASCTASDVPPIAEPALADQRRRGGLAEQPTIAGHRICHRTRT